LPIAVGTVANAGLGAVYIATLLAVLARNYRQADPVGRRQVRWVVYGVYVGNLPVLVAIVAALVEPSLWWLWDASTAGLAVIPIFIFLAITRSNLLDVDRIISVTASYTLLLVVLAVTVLAAAPVLARSACDLAEVAPEPCTPAVSAVIAVSLVLLHGTLRPRLERSFFAERYALQSQFETLLALLSSAKDPETLMKVVGERLDALLRPECCVLYGRAEPVFAPVFVRGRVVPTPFEIDGALAGILVERSAPLDLERDGLDGLGLGAAERSALESLGASALLPVTRGDTLAGFICLGPKKSGDVYTGTDLTLLAALASRISAELLRFGEQQLLREARVLEGRLRRYVPASVRAQLARGAELEAGEREVSVLFVDIRGYASYAEGRRAEEIFSTVNRYTEAVSSVVTEHKGSIVEFNGDGLMAVFGAPEPLAAKERCALAAGREMVARVRGLAGAGPPIEVGVGIATGPAYVGPIRAVDRLIWSAIGNTTNLAARLQALTRELRAAVVIDDETWRRGGHAAAAFVLHPELPIRGLQERRNVHALAPEKV
jgi:class 3 adenylate cyclase